MNSHAHEAAATSATAKTPKVGFVSLGCPKALTDSELILTQLSAEGYQTSKTFEGADLVIVNTCGFIGPAKQESIRVLNELAAGKKRGQLLIAAGCLSQRYGAQLLEWVPALDGIIGTRRWMDIVGFVHELRERRSPEVLYHLPETAHTVGADEGGVVRAAVQGTSAYLKVADGCRRPCAFCAIPLIKGTPRDRSASQNRRAPPASGLSSTPISRPLPRTSLTCGLGISASLS